MRNIKLLFVFAAFSVSGFSQTDTISDNIYQKNNKLGIGISEPDATFHVKDSISTLTYKFNTGHSQLKIGNAGTGYSGLILDAADGDGIGSDYFGIYQDDSLNLKLESMYHAGDIVFMTKLGLGLTPEKESMRIAKGGNVGIGTSTPDEKLDVNGGLKIGNTTNTNEGVLRWTGSDFEGYDGSEWLSLTSSSGTSSSVWQTSNYDTYFNTGNVGIGTSTPYEKLDVNGGLKLGNTTNTNEGVLRWTGSDFEGYDGSEWLSLTSSSGTSSSVWQTSNNDTYYNTGNVGIGSEPTNHLLNLQANIGSGIERNLLMINNLSDGNLSYTGILLKTGDGYAGSTIQDYSKNYNGSPNYDFGGFLNISNGNSGVMLHANSTDGIIKFYTGHDPIGGAGYERMRINGDGNVGIGTAEPFAKLHVADGDIYISDIDKGIIMKSPDGQCWRGVIDNSGNLNFTSITCPESDIVKSNQLKSASEVFVYPNPTNGIVTIDLSQVNISKPTYSIFNLNGQLTDNGKIKNNVHSIDISSLSTGVYLLNIYDKKGNQISSEKIIKE